MMNKQIIFGLLLIGSSLYAEETLVERVYNCSPYMVSIIDSKGRTAKVEPDGKLTLKTPLSIMGKDDTRFTVNISQNGKVIKSHYLFDGGGWKVYDERDLLILKKSDAEILNPYFKSVELYITPNGEVYLLPYLAAERELIG